MHMHTHAHTYMHTHLHAHAHAHTQLAPLVMQVVAMEDEEVQYDAQSAHGINVRAAPSFGTADGITGAHVRACMCVCVGVV